MAHDIKWLKQGRVLYANYKGHQTLETLTACLDEMAAEFDTVERPVVVLINWQEVESVDEQALLKVRGHRAYSHPMAARGVLVGMGKQAQLENEITAVTTRKASNTLYFDTMDDAMDYLKFMLEDEEEQT